MQLDPKSPAAYVHIGQIYEVMGKPDQALDNYQKALALQPTSATINNAIGNIYVRKGDLKNRRKVLPGQPGAECA